MRAVIAPHVTDLTRYTGNGLEYQVSDEATISIVGQLEDLRQIEEIIYADYHIGLDHTHQRARHRHHHDPAIPFKLDDEHILQVFLYGLKPDPGMLEIGLCMQDGRRHTLKGEVKQKLANMFQSRLSEENDWTLIVESETPLDLIVQRKIGTQESEVHRLLSPGRHELEVKPQFCERYALCLSPANDPFGSIEVKHSFIGEVGAASGRFLWSRNRLWLPPIRTLTSYVSLLVDCLETPLNDAINDELKNADEVEVITNVEQADKVHNLLKRYPNLRSKLTIASRDFNAAGCDIALIEPDSDIPSNWMGRTSCLLLKDQAGEGFRSLLELTLTRLTQDEKLAERAVEGLWTTAAANYQQEGRNTSYGIAWTVSSQSEQKGKVSLLRTMATASEDVKDKIHKHAAQPFNASVFKTSR